MGTARKLVSPDVLARSAPKLDELKGCYDWNSQRMDYGSIRPVAYKMSTQTFTSSGQAKDSDKDYDK